MGLEPAILLIGKSAALPIELRQRSHPDSPVLCPSEPVAKIGNTGDPNDANGIVLLGVDMVDRTAFVYRAPPTRTRSGASFRRLARKYHPDVSTEPNAEDRFKEISEAYATLTDPVRKRQVDRRPRGANLSKRPVWFLTRLARSVP